MDVERAIKDRDKAIEYAKDYYETVWLEGGEDVPFLEFLRSVGGHEEYIEKWPPKERTDAEKAVVKAMQAARARAGFE